MKWLVLKLQYAGFSDVCFSFSLKMEKKQTQCLKNASVITPSNVKIFTSSFSGLRIWKLSSCVLTERLGCCWVAEKEYWLSDRGFSYEVDLIQTGSACLYTKTEHSPKCVLIHQLSLLFEIQLNITICNSDAWNSFPQEVSAHFGFSKWLLSGSVAFWGFCWSFPSVPVRPKHQQSSL